MFIVNLPRSKAGHARMLERPFYEISPSLPPKLSSCPSNTGSYWLSHDVGLVLASFNQTGEKITKKINKIKKRESEREENELMNKS